jgi:hypothetical protein
MGDDYLSEKSSGSLNPWVKNNPTSGVPSQIQPKIRLKSLPGLTHSLVINRLLTSQKMEQHPEPEKATF